MNPTNLLTDIQHAVRKLGANAFTKSAIDGGQITLGTTSVEMIAVILARTDTTCYKTMASVANAGAMQDVYNWQMPNGQWAYVKFSLAAGSKVVVSFKEL